MGLDMYLSTEVFVSNLGDEKKREAILKTLGATEYASTEGIRIEVPLGYWRKANAIHAWFVKTLAKGEDACQEIRVVRKDLETLQGLCKEILKNPSKALKILPPQGGFFFGNTEIDDYYFETLTNTVKICERVLKSPYDSFTYQASW